MNRKVIVAGATVCALFSGAALAQPYLGIDAGISRYDLDASSFDVAGVSGSVDEEGTVLGLRAGYELNQYVAIEAAYRTLGEAGFNGNVMGCAVDITVDTTVIEATILGQLPLGDRWDLLGRVGAARWDVDADLRSPCVSAADSDDGTGMTYGLGVQYNLTESVGLRAEWQQYEDVADEEEVSTVTAGLIFRF